MNVSVSPRWQLLVDDLHAIGVMARVEPGRYCSMFAGTSVAIHIVDSPPGTANPDALWRVYSTVGEYRPAVHTWMLSSKRAEVVTGVRDALLSLTVDVRAEIIAGLAHQGQVDKAGLPYITHPLRVATRFTDPVKRAIAILHDVVEDTDVTLEQLAGLFDAEIISAVDALTHRKGESNDDYYARVKANPLALEIKAADIDDNADPKRLAVLDEATRDRLIVKYGNARNVLGLVA